MRSIFFLAVSFYVGMFAVVVAGIYMIWILKRYFAKDKNLGRANEYLITNKRVFIMDSKLQYVPLIFALEAVDQVFIKKHIFGSHTVVLGEYRTWTRLRRLKQTSVLGIAGFEAPQFKYIKDIEGLRLALEQNTKCQIKSGYFEFLR